MPATAAPKPFSAAAALFLGTGLAALFLATAHETVMWQLLIFFAVCFAAVLFWFRDTPAVFLIMFVLTAPIDLSKALIIPGGVYSPGLSLFLSDLFLIGLALTWGFRQYVVLRQPLHFDRLHRLGLIFLAWLWFSALYSQDVLAGILAAVSYSKFFLAYYVLSMMLREARYFRLVLAAFFVGFVMQAVYVAAQFVTGSPLELQGAKVTELGTRLVFLSGDAIHSFRPSGFLHHPNVLADYLVFLLPAALALTLLGKRRLGARIWWAALGVSVAGSAILLITLSRGGWISMALATLFLLAVGLRQGLVKGMQLGMLAAALLAGLMVVALAYPAAFLRITQSDHRSTESRMAMIDQAMLIIRNNPVLGVGFGGYNRAARQTTPESFSYLSNYFQDELRKGVVHNKYLLVTAEHGLIGLALFVWLLLRFTSLLFPVSKWHTPVHFALALGLTSGIIGQMAFYVFDHFYADIRPALLWVFFGLLHALLALNHAYVERVQGTQ
ncbi:MAG: O-antigen ligase family protein [Caenispirillum sp.]|nr:O-antigen ligase family protein [Caenispirillum sp.]